MWLDDAGLIALMVGSVVGVVFWQDIIQWIWKR